MKLIVIAAAVLFSTPAIAGTFTSHGPAGTIVTRCQHHPIYGTTCWTNIDPQGNNARVIDTTEPIPNPGKEREMTEPERAEARRKSCESRSVVCLPEPAW